MNLQLDGTKEFIEGEFAGELGEVLIRCNNVMYVKAADEETSMQEWLFESCNIIFDEW